MIDSKPQDYSKGILILKIVGLFLVWLLAAGLVSQVVITVLLAPQLNSVMRVSYSSIYGFAQVFSFIILPGLISLKWKLFRYISIINLIVMTLSLLFIYLSLPR